MRHLKDQSRQTADKKAFQMLRDATEDEESDREGIRVHLKGCQTKPKLPVQIVTKLKAAGCRQYR